MSKLNRVKDVAFLSTYPPRECGLATFTEDLVNEITKAGQVRAHVSAVAKGAENTRTKGRIYIESA